MQPAAAHDIQKTNRIFEQEVAAKRNIDALDQVYTQNARILPPGAEMVSGRETSRPSGELPSRAWASRR